MLRHFGSVPSATIHPRARLLSSVLGVAWAATSCGAPELSTGKSSVANASGELRELLSSEIIGTLTVGGPAVTVNLQESSPLPSVGAQPVGQPTSHHQRQSQSRFPECGFGAVDHRQ
jgi:hypothetical protein